MCVYIYVCVCVRERRVGEVEICRDFGLIPCCIPSGVTCVWLNRVVSFLTTMQSYESQGYGFVEMEDVEGARAAMIALDGSVYGERKLKVNWAAESGAQPAKEDVSSAFLFQCFPISVCFLFCEGE